MIGIIGCLVAFFLVIYLCYKNWSIFYAAILGSLVVIATNALPVMETFNEVYMPKFGSFIVGYFAIILFGAIQARIYTESGAALTIAETIMNTFMKDGMSDNRKQITAILLITLIGTILGFGGIIATVVIILLYPIALLIFERAGIPKKFILGVLAAGTYTFALTSPGSPQVTNIVAMNLLETSSTAAMIPGILGAVAEVVVIVIVLNKMINKAKKNGEVFAYHPNDTVYDSSTEKPKFIPAILPLAMLFVLFNVFNLDIVVCLVAGCILSVALFWKFLVKKGIQGILNEAAKQSLPLVSTIAAVIGFAGVVSSTPAFDSIIEYILGLSLPPMLLLIVCTAFMCALTGGSATGLTVCLPIIGGILINEMGMMPEVVHRVGTFAATTIDTLPYSGSVLMFLPISNMKLKEVYPATFVTTVVATIVGTVVVAVTLLLFPGLA